METGTPLRNCYEDQEYFRIYKQVIGYGYQMSIVEFRLDSEYSSESKFEHCDKFVCNSAGEPYYFNTEKEAKIQLNKWYKPEQIDEDYLIEFDPDLVR